MQHRTVGTVAALVAAVVVGAVLVATMGSTAARFSDTESSSPSKVGAATVALGRDGPGPDLGFDGLRRGEPQTVELTVEYAGSVPAELSLSVAPEDASLLCEQRAAGWQAQVGVPVTVAVGSAEPLSYCSLYDGERLLLGPVEPGSSPRFPITLTLAADALPIAAGLNERDLVTVHADGGFTDSATGHLILSTAPVEGADALAVAPPVVLVAAPGAPDAVAVDPLDPAAAVRVADGATVAAPVELPAQCTAAGLGAEDFAEVVALDPADPVWDATVRRGRGAGPFLVLGTLEPDRIVGSTGADCIVGGAGADEISGAGGDDVLIGGAGDDVLNGDDGRDQLFGDAGNDQLDGGADEDVLDGGAGDAICTSTPIDRTARCTAPLAPEPAPLVVAVPGPEAPATPPPPVVAPLVEPLLEPAAPLEPEPAATTTEPEPVPPSTEPEPAPPSESASAEPASTEPVDPVAASPAP